MPCFLVLDPDLAPLKFQIGRPNSNPKWSVLGTDLAPLRFLIGRPTWNPKCFVLGADVAQVCRPTWNLKCFVLGANGSPSPQRSRIFKCCSEDGLGMEIEGALWVQSGTSFGSAHTDWWSPHPDGARVRWFRPWSVLNISRLIVFVSNFVILIFSNFSSIEGKLS